MYFKTTTNPHQIPSAVPGISWPPVFRPRAAQILSMLWQLEQTQWWSADQLEQAQFKQLGELLDNAHYDSAHYHEQLEKIGYSPGMQITRAFWNTLPVLTRDDLQQEPDKLKCRDYPKQHGKLSKLSSSGATGQPVTIYRPAITKLFYDVHNFRSYFFQFYRNM